MNKELLPNRVVNISFAPVDQALTKELKERLAAKDYLQPDAPSHNYGPFAPETQFVILTVLADVERVSV